MTSLLQADMVSVYFSGNLRRLADFRLLSEDGEALGAIEEIGIHALGRFPLGDFEALRPHEYHVTDARGNVIVRASGNRAWLRARGSILDPEGGLIARLEQVKRIGPMRVGVKDGRGRALGSIERSAEQRFAVAMARESGTLIALAYPTGKPGRQFVFQSFKIEFQSSAEPTDRMIVFGSIPLLYGPLVGFRRPMIGAVGR